MKLETRKVNLLPVHIYETREKMGIDAAADAALTEPTGVAKVLCPNPNVFNEADRDLLPTEGFGFQNASYSVSGVYNKQAWIEKMQPLPKYVLALNKSHIPGIFEV